MNKVVLIGCGNVGMSYAYLLVTGDNLVSELVLIDIDKDLALAQAKDLTHASAYSNSSIKVRAGDYSDCKDASIVCICAGVNQSDNQTRLDLVDKNAKIFKNIINEINKVDFKGVYLIATNPLDIMSYLTYKLSGLDSSRVIGSGTTLDTARFRSILATKFNVNSKSVHAYVIGEHGDSEVVCFSNATIGTNKIDLNKEEKENIIKEVKESAYQIIQKKGNTSYGIGVCLTKITNAILGDSKEVMTVSCYNKEHDCYFGIPASVGKQGISEIFYIELEKEEEKQLSNSIKLINNVKNLPSIRNLLIEGV